MRSFFHSFRCFLLRFPYFRQKNFGILSFDGLYSEARFQHSLVFFNFFFHGSSASIQAFSYGKKVLFHFSPDRNFPRLFHSIQVWSSMSGELIFSEQALSFPIRISLHFFGASQFPLRFISSFPHADLKKCGFLSHQSFLFLPIF